MSRSFKKNPGIKDSWSGKKFGKNQANRRVRHYKRYLSNGGSYKKLYEKYDICDYNFRHYSLEEHKRWAEEQYGDNITWNHIKQCYQTKEDYMIRMYWRYVAK
jgi:hypothetical protein